jgi:L-ascorbate metabolism protein UlaG (beta-lactamase superfamily)
MNRSLVRKRVIGVACVVVFAAAVWFVCKSEYFGESPSSMEAIARRRLDAAGQTDTRPAKTGNWLVDTMEDSLGGLEAHPSDGTNWNTRRKLLEAIDVPINARRNDAWRRAVGAVFRRRMDKAIAEISAARVTSGMRIWRMYNMGFVVKSAEATVGFDIHPGWVFDNPMDEAQQKRLAGALDVAFVSHWHPDHCSRPFLKQMLAGGKKIVLIDSLAKELTGENVIRIPGIDLPLRVAGVDVYCHTGRQFPTARNNVYIVRIGGLLVMHQGDNDKTSLYKDIAAEHKVDVLLGNCWARLGSCIKGISPRLVITGHENEIKHPPALRSGYPRTFRELDSAGLAPPWNNGPQVRVLFWGEHTDWSGET